MVNKIREASS